MFGLRRVRAAASAARAPVAFVPPPSDDLAAAAATCADCATHLAYHREFGPDAGRPYLADVGCAVCDLRAATHRMLAAVLAG